MPESPSRTVAEAAEPRSVPLPVSPPAGSSKASKVAAASLIGTTIEYYDFAVYGTASALVLGPAFFPSGNPTVSSLAAFLTFAAAFLSRPLGVVLFGTIGDRLGRRRALVASLLLMGLATVGVGLLPTYETAGLLAPVLLVTLRLLQGVSMGGEWGGAVLLAAEHAPPGRRALYAAVPNVGPSLGFLLSTAVILPTLNIVGRDGFTDWAWRVPFLLSAVLVMVGLWVRTTVSESPVFQDRPAAKTSGTTPKSSASSVSSTDSVSRFPLGTLVARYPGRLLLGTGAAIGGSAVYYLTIVYSLSYGPKALGIPQNTMLTAASVGAAAGIAITLPVARLADRVGRRPLMLAGAAGCVVWAVPMYGSLSTGNGFVITGAYTVGLMLLALMFSPVAAFLAELFPARLRYTGASAAFILANTLGGGFAPLVATWLNSQWSSPLVLGFYTGGLCLISLVCLWALPETREDDFTA
ncbi:MFS transporter [Streptomyces caniscabiei]|uniref:MHS family MFS transporter n=1 Tax=Streptomyces caniscabiei TaxID=2746961 RepID=A0A927QH61_9ACTN|nr:MFS transporter [Streptomyces caniscabiei]MBD9725520.1 MHS family MFS transporter [Streptomyces caniscabiei]MDX3510221.1 MFS transporter [Streptomyces caniscabiei]MDX3720984.1 MFS transporter [Streptomyces caniscabiei]MDX3728947.1 MFS transporter [Streptomyces caniscabiei]WEO27833.1 MFS transporter [Streptomyces caniscabiei]